MPRNPVKKPFVALLGTDALLSQCKCVCSCNADGLILLIETVSSQQLKQLFNDVEVIHFFLFSAKSLHVIEFMHACERQTSMDNLV